MPSYLTVTSNVLFLFTSVEERCPEVYFQDDCNLLSANPTEWSNTRKTIRLQKPTNCLSVFDYFVGSALKGLRQFI